MNSFPWKSQKINSAVLSLFLVAAPALLALGSSTLFRTPQSLAQTLDPQKAKADNLLEQGNQQFLNNQLQAAIQPFQQALSRIC